MIQFLHSHPLARARQVRWVVPLLALLFLAVLATMGVLYDLANQDVGTEFFKAHKTISHTGQLLHRGVGVGIIVLVVAIVLIGLLAFKLTHRIVRPLHTLHRALDELVTGDLGVRVELHRHDEFQEIGAALNALAGEFCSTLTRIHNLVDRVDALAEQVSQGAADQSAPAQLRDLAGELNASMDFFRIGPQRIIAEKDN